MPGKVATMRDAVADLVRDGDTVAIEGFTHLISFRGRARDHPPAQARPHLARMTPDLDLRPDDRGRRCPQAHLQLARQPGRRGPQRDPSRIEPARWANGTLEVEEYSHFGMVARYTAGAANLPFMPLRSYFETDLPKANPLIRPIESPYGDETVYAVPPLKPDVTVIHAQRADANGNTQVWGLLGCQKEAAFAAERVIVVVEELVDEAVIRADPNRTIIPGLVVDAVSWSRGAPTPRTSRAHTIATTASTCDWDPISRDEDATEAWLRDWVYEPPDGRAAYVARSWAEERRCCDRPARQRVQARSTTGSTADGRARPTPAGAPGTRSDPVHPGDRRPPSPSPR
jgi:glutaconate CoA-transferase, subunit A